MKNKHLFVLIFSTLVFVFIASLFNTMNVSAEDEVPPLATTEPVATEEPVAIEEPPTSEEAGATEEPLPAQEQVPTAEPVATEEPATGILPIFEQLPEDTTVVVYEEDGDVLPLASQAAADALAEPDPQFCPAGLPPLDPGCSPVRTTIADAINDAYTAGGDGTIYVEAGTFTENVTIDGSLFTGPAPTIFNVVGAGSGLSIVDGFIQILNMNTFTLSGFTVNEYVEANDNNGTLNLTDILAGADGGVSDGNAIVHVYDHNGDIVLTDVTANNGSDFGAELNNTSGSGNITVDNSTFTGNALGMEAYSAGNITLTDTVANSNLLNGTYLDTSAGTGDINVTNSTFNANTLYGLVNYSAGDITLDGVTANNNVNFTGILADTATYGTGDININNSVVSGNGFNGLEAFSNGSITLNDVTASNNADVGAYMDNSGGTSEINIIDSTFSGNTGYGVLGFSADDIIVSGSTFDTNDIGAYLDNTSGTGDITVTNTTATGNIDHGLSLQSSGSTTVDTVTASGNGLTGVITGGAPGGVSVVNSTFTGNGTYGFQAISSGSVTLNGVLSNGNTSGGTFIDNTIGSGDIIVNNSIFSGNTGYGFQAFTDGNSTLDGVTANNNGSVGLVIDGTGPISNITISNSIFNGNTDMGLLLTTNGDVILDNVTASNNTNNDGTFINTSGNVTVICGSYENNGGYGINNFNGNPMTLDSVDFAGNGIAPYNGAPTVIDVTCFTPTVTPTPTATLPPTLTPMPTVTAPPVTGDGDNGTGRPLHFVYVDGDLIELPTPLNCVNYRGTRLILPSDDSVVFLCPLQATGKLDLLPINPLPGELPVELPGDLPDDTAFVSGFITHLIRDNNREQTTLLARAALVSFTIPQDMQDEDLVILFWNIEEELWLEVDPGIDLDDNRYDACVKTLMGRFDDERKELFHREACVDYTGTFVLARRSPALVP
jgi:hypothetical protein